MTSNLCVGDHVIIDDYLGHKNIPARVVDIGPPRRNGKTCYSIKLEREASYPVGTVLYYFENELHHIKPRLDSESK